MSAYGYFTKKSLDSMGKFMIVGLIAIVIASIINIFIGSSLMTMVISALAIIIFLGLTAYDTQKIREMLSTTSSSSSDEIQGALTLYLDFINLFLNLLQVIWREERMKYRKKPVIIEAIEFVYSILWLHKYNQQLFYKYMMGVNNILKFRAENEEYYARNKKPHPDFNDMVKASIEMKFNTIENLKSFIHVIPRTKEFTLSLNDIVLHHHKMMNKNLYLLEKINWKR